MSDEILVATDGGEVLEDDREADDLLPFKHPETDTVEGIGRIVSIVEIGEHREILKNAGSSVVDGRCVNCGYDRARVESHTEADAGAASCAACSTRLAVWGEK